MLAYPGTLLPGSDHLATTHDGTHDSHQELIEFFRLLPREPVLPFRACLSEVSLSLEVESWKFGPRLDSRHPPGHASEKARRAEPSLSWISTTLSRPATSAPSRTAGAMLQNLTCRPAVF